jgi:plasmid maintenance system antidote protein VapI
MTAEAFSPLWISPPGDTIADLMEMRSVTADALSADLGCAREELEKVIVGEIRLSPELADGLKRCLGATKSFWLRRDAQYWADRRKVNLEGASNEWLKSLPVRDMVRWGWISPGKGNNDLLSSCLAYFGVDDVVNWHLRYGNVLRASAFRTSPTYSSGVAAVLTWLRQCEIEAGRLNCSTWSPVALECALPAVRQLTRTRNPLVFLPELRRICAECGLAVSLVRAPSGCRASGAARFLRQDLASISLSLRYLTDDHFWFTFFHEVGHLLLHSSTLLFVEDGEGSSLREEEANSFASCVLIPEEFQEDLLGLAADRHSVRVFARRVGVSPGIVVGQLQHRGRLGYSRLNNLKIRYNWESIPSL